MRKLCKTLCLLLFLFSCSTDDFTENKVADENCISETQLIFEAQTFFEKAVINSVDTVIQKGNNKDEPRKKIKKNLQWDKAFIRELSFGTGVVVPISYEKELYIRKANSSVTLSQLTYMLFYIDYNGKMKAELVTARPDETYTTSTNENQVFSGIVMVEDWHGNYLKGFSYKTGQIETIIIVDENSKVETENCLVTEYYECLSSNGGVTWNCELYDYESICYGGTGVGNNDYHPIGGNTGDPSNPSPDSDTLNIKPITPCKTGDNILDNTSIQQSFANIWNESKALNSTIPMSERLEQGGWIVEKRGKLSFMPFPISWQRTACGINPPANWVNDIPSNVVGVVHSHPFYEREDTRPVCGYDFGVESYGTMDTFIINKDDEKFLEAISGFVGHQVKGYIIDGIRIRRYVIAGDEMGIIPFNRCGY